MQQKQKWYRKIFLYQDTLLPSFFIILCLCPYNSRKVAVLLSSPGSMAWEKGHHLEELF